jgi:outer membrane protein W
VGLAGELEIERIWSLSAAALYVNVSEGSYARYEVDGRWHPAQEGWLRPYLGAGVAVAHTSLASVGGPSRTRLGGIASAGVDVPVLHTLLFAEVVGVETGSFSVEVRGGLRLLVFGQ